MWTLHKLNNRTLRHNNCDNSKAPPGRVELSTHPPDIPWEFEERDLLKFPALRKRNFFCIQRHQARALHYDLRLQLDGGTISWAIPRGLIGMSKTGESSHMAVQTTFHPISYTVHEGTDGQVFKSGRRAGTLLWDIGEYYIGNPKRTAESESEDERRLKKRKVSPDKDDTLGRHEEDKLRHRFHRPISTGKQRTIHLTLKNGRKMLDHSFILVLDTQNSRSFTYGRGGRTKKTWFIRLPYDIDAYDWDKGGEDGDFWGRSVKTGRTFAEVCSGPPMVPVMFDSELVKFAGWSEKTDEIGEAEAEVKVTISPKQLP